MSHSRLDLEAGLMDRAPLDGRKRMRQEESGLRKMI